MIPIKHKWLQPCPTVPGAQLQPAKVSQKEIYSKYIQFQAPLLNRGTIWLADNEQVCVAKEGTCLRPGETFIIDIDVNRPVGINLADYFFAGDYGGDKLIVSYLEEEQDGKD